MQPGKLLVLGATGRTGQEIVKQGLDAGHELTAFVRPAARLPVQHDRLRTVVGTLPGDRARLEEAARGQDAVISALGRGTSFKSTGLIQDCVPAILSAMGAAGVRRLIFTSAVGVGGPVEDLPLVSRIVHRLLLKDIYADKTAGEALIRRSDLDWTLVQPVQLTNGPLTRTYRAGERLPLRGMPTIARADVAHFILSQLEDTTYIRKAVTVSR